jgi:hypothetical protein
MARTTSLLCAHRYKTQACNLMQHHLDYGLMVLPSWGRCHSSVRTHEPSLWLNTISWSDRRQNIGLISYRVLHRIWLAKQIWSTLTIGGSKATIRLWRLKEAHPPFEGSTTEACPPSRGGVCRLPGRPKAYPIRHILSYGSKHEARRKHTAYSVESFSAYEKKVAQLVDKFIIRCYFR